MRWLALGLCLLPAAVLASEATDEAEQMLKRMQYQKALAQVELILRAVESGPEDLAAAYRIQGLSLAALNRSKEAVEAFRYLLAIEPDFRLPKSVSPKLRTPFYQAVGMVENQKPIRISHKPPQAGEKLGGLKLRARLLSDPLRMVKGIRFRYLGPSGETKDLSVLVEGPKVVSFKLPDDFGQQEFSYWVEAFGEHGGVLARAASAGQPFVVRAVPKPVPEASPVAVVRLAEPPPADPAVASASQDSAEPTRWYQSWWFWTAVGVVAAGAITAGVLVGTSGDDPDPLHWDIQVR